MNLPQFPHCDQRVLHAPEDNCEYCNMHPEWQALRIAWGISFTGHSYDANGNLRLSPYGHYIQPCPAEAARGMMSLNSWHGNIAMTPEASAALDEFAKQRNKDIAEQFDLCPNCMLPMTDGSGCHMATE